ncbi:MAG: hypothetical protein V1661_03085 [bacterium]
MESKNIVDYYAGSMPVIITARHDGHATVIGDEILPILRDQDINDHGTMLLGLMTRMELGKKPFLLLNKIARNRCTPEMFGIYYERALATARLCLEKWGKCFVFDLHRFYKYPPVGEYDIFLGTNHGQTAGGDFYKEFASLLTKEIKRKTEVKVYVPGKEPKDGERFGATREKTLVNWLRREEPRVEAIQVEFYKDFLSDAYFIPPLSRALAKAISQIAK